MENESSGPVRTSTTPIPTMRTRPKTSAIRLGCLSRMFRKALPRNSSLSATRRFGGFPKTLRPAQHKKCRRRAIWHGVVLILGWRFRILRLLPALAPLPWVGRRGHRGFPSKRLPTHARCGLGMLGVAGGSHHVLLLLLVVPSLEPATRTLPICHLANLPFLDCLAVNKHSRPAALSDEFSPQTGMAVAWR